MGGRGTHLPLLASPPPVPAKRPALQPLNLLQDMRTFSNEDVRNYYDHTEPHYRQFWKMEDSMGLHYGIWDGQTKRLSEAILNTNARLASLGQVKASDRVLDAGCGVGGSAIFLAKQYGCHVTGITLSQRQVKRATGFAERNGVAALARFEQMDYTRTRFPDQHFDLVWAVESMQTATDKSLFFQEMGRVLRPGGRLLVADVFKQGCWKIEDTPVMQTMLNGWAMSDILSVESLADLAQKHNFALHQDQDVTQGVERSIRRYYWYALAGMIGTKWYNLFHDATHFSKIHYTTGFAQYKAWKKGLWSYRLLEMGLGG